MIKKLSLLLLFISQLTFVKSQVVINEIQQSNTTTLVDNDGDYPDWFELYNSGSSSVNLSNYTATDNLAKTERWSFPDVDILPGEYLVVFASGKSDDGIINHWESPAKEADSWRYLIADDNTSDEWRNINFDDTNWNTGIGGFGYGDDDDGTIVIDPISSLFIRKTFTVTDTSDILTGVLHIDYDDGFVAYLNGTEIARENMDGNFPAYNDFSSAEHEASVYSGGAYSEYTLDREFLSSILIEGENVLSIQVHNADSESSDLTMRPNLSLSIASTNTYWNTIPTFFTPVVSSTIHTDFSLNNGKENLYLINQGFIEDDIALIEVPTDYTYGRTTDGTGNFEMLSSPTPGASNNGVDIIEGIITDTVLFSIPAGLYTSTQTVSLSTNATGVEIKYTTNGSKPSSTSTTYTGPITVDENTVIRAIVYQTNYLTLHTETNTYLIGNDFNPQNVGVMAISVKDEDFFDFDEGIYELGPNAEEALPKRGANFWQDWEKEIHIEYFDENDTQQLEQDCGVKIFGGWSRAQDMKSLRLIARDIYGDNTFSHQFFPDKEINSFRQLVLRNSGNDFNATHLRDALNHEAIKEEGNHDRMAYRPLVVFINGEYWGIHNLRERINPHYIENNHDIDDDDITLIEFAGADEVDQTAKQGEFSHWTDFSSFVLNNDMSITENYTQVKNNLDIENFADYMISQSYHINWDSPHNNCRMWRASDNSTKWRYIYYDTDFGLDLFGLNYTSKNYDELNRLINDDKSDNTLIFRDLLENEEFKCYFINRYADLMNTSYKVSNYEGVLDSIINLIDPEMDQHHDRWGNNRESWEGEIGNVRDFIQDRRVIVQGHIEDQFTLGGNYELTIEVEPAGSGTVKVSTISPSSYPWTGTYFNDCPVEVTAIPNIGYLFDNFTAENSFNGININSSITFDFDGDVITAHFITDPNPVNIVISEINYNSSTETNTDDWIELHNDGTNNADLSGWTIQDESNNSFIIPEGTILNANEYLVIVENMIQFDSIHGNISNKIGDLGFKFSNSGETLTLLNEHGKTISSVTYSDESPWSNIADGQGGTLEFQYLDAGINNVSNWSFGCLNGSPGTEYIPCPCVSPYLGEKMYTCESDITLTTGIDIQPTASIKWYRDGELLITESSSELTNATAGSYTVIISDANCITEGSVIVTDEIPTVNLGSDFEYCSDSPLLLQSPLYTNGVYRWFTNDVDMNTNINTMNISGAGTYKVEIDLGNCPTITDEIIVTQPVLTPNHSYSCTSGSHDLSVTGSGDFEWYDASTGGNLVNEGNTFTTPNLTETTTYFVSDASYFGESAGPEDYTYSDTWGHDNFEDYKLRFEVLQDLYLNFITVFPKPGTENVTINLTRDGNETVIETITVPVTDSLQRIYLGWDLSPDDYVLDAQGTDGELYMNNENSNYPFTYTNWLSITGTYPEWAATTNGWYFFFYNFEFSNTPTPNTCPRTAVIANVCDEPTIQVVVAETNIKASESTEVTVSVDTDYTTLLVDLGYGANPRYLTEAGTFDVQYLIRGEFDAEVTVSDHINNVYNQSIDLDLTVCHTPEIIISASNLNLETCNSPVTITATDVISHMYYWTKEMKEYDTGYELNEITINSDGTYHLLVDVKDELNEELCSETSNALDFTICLVGTDDLENNENFSVHPNPSSTVINLNVANITSVNIYDAIGRLILTDTKSTLDISELAKGIYVVEVFDLENRYMSKFEKK